MRVAVAARPSGACAGQPVDVRQGLGPTSGRRPAGDRRRYPAVIDGRRGGGRPCTRRARRPRWCTAQLGVVRRAGPRVSAVGQCLGAGAPPTQDHAGGQQPVAPSAFVRASSASFVPPRGGGVHAQRGEYGHDGVVGHRDRDDPRTGCRRWRHRAARRAGHRPIQTPGDSMPPCGAGGGRLAGQRGRRWRAGARWSGGWRRRAGVRWSAVCRRWRLPDPEAVQSAAVAQSGSETVRRNGSGSRTASGTGLDRAVGAES